MKPLEKIHEGKAKIIYTVEDPCFLVQYFKDDATAFDAAKRGSIPNKGILNNQISGRIFQYLTEKGVPNHFVRELSDREMLVRRLEIIPLEVVMRNIVAGSLAARLGREEGEPLPSPILEYYYKDDALHDPMVNLDHILVFGLCTAPELKTIEGLARRVNELLIDFFARRRIRLVDFKLEFGRVGGREGEILLGDEITPDACRLWDSATGEKLDKDRFRRDLGKIGEAYQEVHRRVMAAT